MLKALLTQVGSKKVLTTLLHHLHETQNLQIGDIIHLFHNSTNKITVPLSLFKGKINATAVLCKYLKEEKNLTYQEIGKRLNRDQRSVWTACRRAKGYTKPTKDKYPIPLTIFSNRKLSVMEHITLFLHHTYKLTNPQIAKYLHKSPNSIAVLHKRAKVKHE